MAGRTANSAMEVRGRMFLYRRERAQDEDVVAVISLAGDLNRGWRILHDMIEKGDVIRSDGGSCTLSPQAFEQAFFQELCDLQDDEHSDEGNEDERDD